MTRHNTFWITILLSICCLLALASCGESTPDASKESTAETQTMDNQTEGTESETLPESETDPTPTEGLEYRLNEGGQSYSLIGIGDVTDTAIVIPETYNELPVTSIKTNAFNYCEELTSVTIPTSITTIEKDAFYMCPKLIQVDRGISYVDKWVVAFDTNLTRIVMRDDTVGLADQLFQNTDITDITLPSELMRIGNYTFENCSSLTSIAIPKSVSSIGYDAFYGCSSISTVDITDIEAWYNITFGSPFANPLYYAYDLYLNGELVRDVVIPDGVTYIGDYVFLFCKSLTSITIPDSVTSIGDKAFHACISLTNITFEGTKAQWNAISKGNRGIVSTGGYTIYCTDGTIDE